MDLLGFDALTGTLLASPRRWSPLFPRWALAVIRVTYFPQPLVRPEAHIPSVCTELCNPESPQKNGQEGYSEGLYWANRDFFAGCR